MPPPEEQEVLNLELKRELVVLVTLVSFTLPLSTFISFPDVRLTTWVCSSLLEIDNATDRLGMGDKYDDKINKLADGQINKNVPGGATK